MRRVWAAARLAAALLCGGCAAQAVSVQPNAANYSPNTLNSTEVLSAANKPAGYYPGYAEAGLPSIASYNAWLAQNRTGIDEIQSRISAIREGRIAPGCIGEDQYTCIATLAQKFAIADRMGDNSAGAATKYDVNGKPLRPSKLEVLGYVPRPDIGEKHPNATLIPTHFVLKIDSSGKVSALEVKFNDDPTAAHTQEEYDATDAYEAVSTVSAKQCPTLSRADVAKWIENTIKPSLKSSRQRVRRGTAEIETSKKAALCGRTFQFKSVSIQYRHDMAGGADLIVE